MSEITPDPVFDKLSRFTPSVPSLDPAEVLFCLGQASAPTHWGWKIAVSGLALVIVALLGDDHVMSVMVSDALRSASKSGTTLETFATNQSNPLPP